MTSATRRRLGALMLATLFPAAANGQRTPSTPAPALSFDEMALRVARQRRRNGHRGGYVGAAVQRQADGSLERDALDADGGRAVTFREGQVREVQQRLRDRRRDGAAIGFLAGWLVPAAVCASRSDSSETSACVLDTLLLGGLPGMAIGAAVDAAHAKTVTVFRSADSARLVMAPIISRRQLGVQALMRLGR
jgi:hypothetical protein